MFILVPENEQVSWGLVKRCSPKRLETTTLVKKSNMENIRIWSKPKSYGKFQWVYSSTGQLFYCESFLGLLVK